MAKTQGDANWPNNFEAVEDQEENNQSYHTLKHKISQDDDIFMSGEIMSVQLPNVLPVGYKDATLLKTDLPHQFRDTTLTGFKSKLGVNSEAPSCFCEKKGICLKHNQFQPTIESVIELLEEQVQSLNRDEKSLDENLDFIGKSMNTILFSRKDTFKEQITRAYVSKECDAEYYKNRCEEMEKHEEMYQKNL